MKIRLRTIVLSVFAAAAFVVWAIEPAWRGVEPEKPVEWVEPDFSDYRRDEITFRNDGLSLAGQIFTPDNPTAAVVIVHGSGTSDRTNLFYQQLVAALLSHHIAVLLPDKRGSDRSEGDWRTASFEDLADDTIAALAEARTIWPNLPVSLVGMSQGARVAPIAYSRGARPDSIVSISGSVVPAHDQLVFEEANSIAGMGVQPVVARSLAPLSAWTIREWRQKDFWDAVGNIDPLDAWSTVRVPSLALFGSQDENVPVQRSVSRLRDLGSPHIEIAVFDGMGHAFASPEDNGIAERVIDRIARFLTGPQG